jgi:hypothetical protein
MINSNTLTRKDDTKTKRLSLFDTKDDRNKVAYEDYQCLAMLCFSFGFALFAHFYIFNKKKKVYFYFVT